MFLNFIGYVASRIVWPLFFVVFLVAIALLAKVLDYHEQFTAYQASIVVFVLGLTFLAMYDSERKRDGVVRKGMRRLYRTTIIGVAFVFIVACVVDTHLYLDKLGAEEIRLDSERWQIQFDEFRSSKSVQDGLEMLPEYHDQRRANEISKTDVMDGGR